MTSVAAGGGIGTKMSILEKPFPRFAYEPVLLFLQGSMKPRMHSRSRGARAHPDGNTAQRSSTLQEFEGALYCSALRTAHRLHLPHTRHVLFAHAIGDVDRVRDLERQAIARSVDPGRSTHRRCLFSWRVLRRKICGGIPIPVVDFFRDSLTKNQVYVSKHMDRAKILVPCCP